MHRSRCPAAVICQIGSVTVKGMAHTPSSPSQRALAITSESSSRGQYEGAFAMQTLTVHHDAAQSGCANASTTSASGSAVHVKKRGTKTLLVVAKRSR